MADNKQIVIQQISVGQMYRQREDIASWMEAVKSAESVHFPRWKRLLEIYDRVVLDGFATSALRKRVQEATNTAIHYRDTKGNHGEEVEKITAKPFFQQILRYIIEARFWGHSVVEPQLKGGNIVRTDLIPRHHVDRVKGLIYLQEYVETGAIQYREGAYARHLLEIGDARDLGLLAKVAPYVLYKQGGMADWSHFAELFGMPTRIYKYNPLDPLSRLEVEKQAKAQGSAAYLIVPEGVSMEFQEASSATGSAEMYNQLRQAMNEEISITLLGNNLTTSNGKTGTFALGDIHQAEQRRIHQDDLKFVEGVLNDSATDFLQYWGVPLKEGFVFEFDRSERLSLAQRIDLDTKLNGVAPIAKKYFYETYGVPPAPKEEMPDPETPDKDPDTGKEKAGKPTDHLPDAGNMIVTAHGHEGHVCGVADIEVPKAISNKMARLFVKMLERVFRGLLPEGTTDKDMVAETGRMLFTDGFRQGFGAFDLKDARYLASVSDNLFTFSGAKNLAELKTLRDLVYKDGKKLPFTEFRKAAKAIYSQYREDWLQTEYNQVIRAGTMAQQWRDAERTEKLYPYLLYKTKQDSRVRQEHVSLEGVIRPLNDTFWLTYFPPNGWNCRCSIRKISQADIDSGKYAITPDQEAMDAGAAAGIEDYWKGNVGKTGFVFRASGHTYFKNISPAENAHLDKIARFWRNTNPVTREAGYTTRLERDNKAFTQIHEDADPRDLTGNMQAAEWLNNAGVNVRIQPHIQNPWGDNLPSPELLIFHGEQWKVADVKWVQTKNLVAGMQRSIESANRQGAWAAVIVIPELATEEEIGKALSYAWQADRNKSVKAVWMVQNGEASLIERP
jgi:SPP1 gp7 family putative phage head morphogenesis protein